MPASPPSYSRQHQSDSMPNISNIQYPLRKYTHHPNFLTSTKKADNPPFMFYILIFSKKD
jgi:hypothetical protein